MVDVDIDDVAGHCPRVTHRASAAAIVVAACAASVVAADVGAVGENAVAVVAARFGFSGGDRPVVAVAPDQGSLSAAACGACHVEVYADWQSTRHRQAFDNAVFQDGLEREPAPRCIHCHAPLREQRALLGPLRGKHINVAAGRVDDGSLVHEGVSCAVCHVRAGAIVAARAVVPSETIPMHDVKVDVGLKDPAFCGSCHQFGFANNSAALMQGTYDEWRAYSAAGGTETCQSCHMPKGRHLFRGAWDTALLERSLIVEREGLTLTLRSHQVGHHFPTGDLFRHLSVEAVVANDDSGGDVVEVAFVGRRFGGQGTDKHVVTDTALRPGRPLVVELPATSRAWRVRYHYAEARHERDGVVAPVVIAEGVVAD